MTTRTWVILGATSLIAEQFAHIAAQNQHHLKLVGRDKDQLTLIAHDIQLRFKVPCMTHIVDFSQPAEQLLTVFDSVEGECDLFIAHSDFTENAKLTNESINKLIQVNVVATASFINHYLTLQQKESSLIYLSSVAACRGRAKNSLYGGSKSAIELYLQGLQQASQTSPQITIARLGFIDTKQTYGLPGVFYAAQPKDCAKACWDAMKQRKKLIYYPKFWWLIMSIIKGLPFFIYKKIGK